MQPFINISILTYTNKTGGFIENVDLLKAEGSTGYTEELPKKQNSIPVFRISLHAICLIGIALNLRICFAKRNKNTKHTTTTKTCVRLLKVMAIADTFSLVSLLLLLSTQFFGINDEIIMHFICKIDLFLMHTASAFSIWCWLVISAVRYIAIYRPYSHLSIRHQPIAAVTLILIACGILESWILYGTGFQFNSCTTMPDRISDKWASRLHIIEIIWSYILPCVLITILDVKVLCFQNKVAVPLKNSQNANPQIATRRSLSESLIRKFTTNDIGSIGSPTSTPSFIFNNDRTKKISFQTIIKKKLSSNGAPKPLYESPEMSIIENPGYMEVQKNVIIEKNLDRKIESWLLGVNRNSTYDYLNLAPRKHSKRTCNQLRVLRRCLFITLLDLSMNLPSYLFRLYLNMISPEEFQRLFSQQYTWIISGFEDISQLLYFAQFSLNALYLVYLVYDPPKKTQMV